MKLPQFYLTQRVQMVMSKLSKVCFIFQISQDLRKAVSFSAIICLKYSIICRTLQRMGMLIPSLKHMRGLKADSITKESTTPKVSTVPNSDDPEVSSAEDRVYNVVFNDKPWGRRRAGS